VEGGANNNGGGVAAGDVVDGDVNVPGKKAASRKRSAHKRRSKHRSRRTSKTSKDGKVGANQPKVKIDYNDAEYEHEVKDSGKPASAAKVKKIKKMKV
jgi:hypothetical protein